MRVELPTFSFLSVALLILILPGHVSSSSIPSVTIIAWLFFCNLIHGVNSVLWLGNQAVHLPPWCDVCKFILVHGLGSSLNVPSFCCASWGHGCTTWCLPVP